MSFKISNIPSLTNELKCIQCNKMLSVLPVYYCSATGNVCGRCSNTLDWMISNGTLERAVAYEAIAKHLLFPCYNKPNGCKAELKWNEVEEHEKSCESTLLLCPFNVNVGTTTFKCDWKGCMTDLVLHLHTDHQHHVQVNPSFILNVHESNVQIFLIKVAEQTFVIFMKYLKETNKFYCTTMYCGKEPEHRLYRYHLELGRFDDYFLMLRKNNVQQFASTDKMIDNYDEMITVDVASVETMLGNPNFIIYCRVTVMKKNKKDITALMEELKLPVETTKTVDPPKKPYPAKNPPFAPPQKPNLVKGASGSASPKVVIQPPKIDKHLLEELECPVCSNYMIPPIYICPTGHSLCTDCKHKIHECPSCRTQIQNTRNFTLERLTTRVLYPCKFVEMGCTDVLTSENLRGHENMCVYSNSKCPLKMLPSICNIKVAPADIIGHIREKHAEFILKTNHQYIRNIKDKIMTSYHVTISEGEVFIVCCKHSATSGPIRFNILHVGMKIKEPKFRYKLEFLDQTGKGLKLVVNRLCETVPSSVSMALKNCLNIPLDLLDPCIVKKAQHMLFFKFLIEKL